MCMYLCVVLYGRKGIIREREVGTQWRDQNTAIDGKAVKVSVDSVRWDRGEDIRVRSSTERPRRYQRRACGGNAEKTSARGHQWKGRECISGEHTMGTQWRHQCTAIDVKAAKVSAESVRWERGEDISVQPLTICHFVFLLVTVLSVLRFLIIPLWSSNFSLQWIMIIS